MEVARQEGCRILLTEDKDSGWLAFVAGDESAGVVLVRFPGNARHTLAASMIRLVTDFGPKLNGTFVVLRPGSVRISGIPGTELSE